MHLLKVSKGINNTARIRTKDFLSDLQTTPLSCLQCELIPKQKSHVNGTIHSAISASLPSLLSSFLALPSGPCKPGTRGTVGQSKASKKRFRTNVSAANT